jgi:hypothetical protein
MENFAESGRLVFSIAEMKDGCRAIEPDYGCRPSCQVQLAEKLVRCESLPSVSLIFRLFLATSPLVAIDCR